MPNSLIFVVILTVWAAYLIQHWIRRRDHVATAKSVDRFSEAMRVLERRQRAPRADITTPTPRSYAVSLTRPAHPDVVVKRAQHGVAAPAPLRARRGLPRPSAAQVRSVLLVLGVLSLIAGVTTWALGQAPWWAAAVGVAGLLAALTGIRLSVGRQRRRAVSPVRAGTKSAGTKAARGTRSRRATTGGKTARPVARRRPAAPASRRPARTASTASHTHGAAHPTVGDAPVRVQQAPAANAAAPAVTGELATTAPVAAPAAAGRDDFFFDVEAHERTTQQAAMADASAQAPEPTAQVAEPMADSSAELAPGTWAPVPVPPPTYTLKARASRPAAAQARQPEPSDVEQVDDLPFDGNALAFDEEFEDLPPVHSVG